MMKYVATVTATTSKNAIAGNAATNLSSSVCVLILSAILDLMGSQHINLEYAEAS